MITFNFWHKIDKVYLYDPYRVTRSFVVVDSKNRLVENVEAHLFINGVRYIHGN